MREELPVDEVLGIVDDHHHDCLGHQVAGGLGHYAHVRVHQVADGLHLALELRVHAARAGRIRVLKVIVFS